MVRFLLFTVEGDRKRFLVMGLDKIESGTPITLRVKRESTVADFETVLIDHVENCLVCKPILHDNKIINFAIPGVTEEVNVYDKASGKLFAWRNIEVKAGYFHKTMLCHLIYLNSEPVPVNRRNSYRQHVDIEAVAEIFHRPAKSVILHDVSNSGVGFISKEREHFEVGRMLKMHIMDCRGKFDFSVTCEIVRERELSSGELEFGCKVTEPSADLANYVAQKQMEERRRVLGMQEGNT